MKLLIALLALAATSAQAQSSCERLATIQQSMAIEQQIIDGQVDGDKDMAQQGLTFDREQLPELQRFCAVEMEQDRRATLPAPCLGMTTKAVIERTSFGKPDHINRTVTAGRVAEQWVYDDGTFLYFTNGRLTAFQD